MCTISDSLRMWDDTYTCSLLKKAGLMKYYHLICMAGPAKYIHIFHPASFVGLHSW